MNEQEASERRIAGGLNCVRPPAKELKGRFAAGLKVVPLSAIAFGGNRKTRPRVFLPPAENGWFQDLVRVENSPVEKSMENRERFTTLFTTAEFTTN